MNGASEYAKLFHTGQYGRLYLVSGSHARGRTFRIFVLPAGETAKPNGPNAPLNKDAVEVYGIISGHPGWTEEYGWLHEGKWQDDFYQLVENEKVRLRLLEQEALQAHLLRKAEVKKSVAELLASY